MRRRLLLHLALPLVGPTLASAQYDPVLHRSWTLLDSHLLIEVVADAPGQVQVLRGRPGQLEVTARSTFGFPGFALTDDFRPSLRLSALGATDVQFLVVVPERVSVALRLPDGAIDLGPARNGRSFSWQATGPAAAQAPRLPGGPPPELPHGLVLVYAAGRAPTQVDIPDLTAVRGLQVRLGGDQFRVAATRPLDVRPGSGRRLSLRLDGEPLDLVLFVPAGGGRFEVTSGATRLVEGSGGDMRSLCGGSAVHGVAGEGIWLRLDPAAGCGRGKER